MREEGGRKRRRKKRKRSRRVIVTVSDLVSGEETPNSSRQSLCFFAAARELLSPLARCLARGPSVTHWPKDKGNEEER